MKLNYTTANKRITAEFEADTYVDDDEWELEEQLEAGYWDKFDDDDDDYEEEEWM